MGTFALILVLVLGGQTHTFVVDHDLTADDCLIALYENVGVPLSCEEEFLR